MNASKVYVTHSPSPEHNMILGASVVTTVDDTTEERSGVAN